MCYASAYSPEPVSIITPVARVIVAIAAMFLLMSASTGCMTIRDCNITIRDTKGSIQVGNKDVKIPLDITTPATFPGVQ